jgi:class 3 adenylate cyclase
MSQSKLAATPPPVYHVLSERVGFLWRDSTYAPLRLLYPITLGTGMLLGLGLGLGLGGISDALGYYVIKETILGAVGGFIGPLFLICLRRLYNLATGRAQASTPVSYLLYYVAGALAGIVMIAVSFVLPARLAPGVWLVFYPLGAAGLFPIVGLFTDFFQEQRDESERTKEIFGKYVSESIARRILASRQSISLEGEKRQTTVLISDIRGFTRMIKERGAEEVVHTLNDYFARMIDIILQYDGTVNKFIGDALVVLYGAPLALGDENERALQTARAMQRQVAAMNAERTARGLPSLHIGIAIDAGEVVVGNIGSPRRLEYTAIGAPVNNAYYLAGLAPADTIYVTENVYQNMTPRASAPRRERVALKGGTGELDVFILDDETSAAANFQPLISSPQPHV